MSNVRAMSDEELRREYRSYLRQNTRAGLGTALSGLMTGVGLVYMALPCGIAAYGTYETAKRIQVLQGEMSRRGISRCRDIISSRLIGTAEKLATTALFLGHDELGYMIQNVGAGTHEVESHSVSEGLNHAVNAPLDEVKEYLGYDNGDPAHLSNMVPLGVTAAAVEVAVNRTGHVGAQMRSRVRT